MRCGRKEEGTEHLLSGARVAIRKGAVHEAERRLDSGLSSLAGEALQEARLLLVELLQEQGRWKESAALLAGFSDERATVDGVCLAGRAAIETLEFTSDEAQSLASRAIVFISDASLKPQTRLRALRLAGAVVCADNSPALARSFVAAAHQSRPSQWSSDDELEWDTQMVYLSHHAQHATEQSEQTFAQLVRLAERAQARTIANARSYRVLAGLALCHRRAGRYQEAIADDEAALGILNRLGRTSSLAFVHAHLAACHRETGQVEQQRLHGQKSLALSQRVDFSHILAVFCVAEARALNGDSRGAERLVMEHTDAMASYLPPRLLQSWLVLRADISWVVGHRDTACEIGYEAIAAAQDRPVDRSNIGAVGRWAAILLASGQRPDSDTIARIRTVRGLTWWDEAERLRALVALDGENEAVITQAALTAALGRLPFAFRSHIARYGLPI